MRRDKSCPGLRMLAAGVLFWAPCAFPEEPSRASSALTQLRRAIPEPFTLEVEVELPVALLLPGQGKTTRVMRVSVGKDVTAIVWKASQLPVPKYYPPDTGGYQDFDYDYDGNLIVSMRSEGATICDQNIHEEYSESAGSSVASDGTVVGRTSGTFLRRYSPSFSNTNGMSMLRAIRGALGRPSGDDFGELEAEEVKADGTHELRVAGQYSPYSGLGVWDLVVDPANSHLVRSGSFGPRGEQPRMQFRNEGTRRFGDVTLAQRGEYISGPQHIVFRLISFNPELDPGVIAEARKVISRARTRLVQVFDYRDDPTNAKVRLVPAGDLDKDE